MVGALAPDLSASAYRNAARWVYVGVAALFGVIGAAQSVLVGGLMVHWTSWRAIFFINVPFGLIAMYLVYRHMPDYHGD